MTQPIPPALDLAAIESKWLRQCGVCDAGLPEYGCTHPSEDYRPVMLSLVREIDRLRSDEPWVSMLEQRDEAIAERDRLREELRVAGAWMWPRWRRLREDVIGPLRAERDRLRGQITEAEAVIVRAQDALGVDHPVWVILDDYDGSMDSVRALVRERDEARAERDRYAEVVQAAQQWRDAIKPCVCGNGDPHQYLVREGESALIAAVDRLTPGDETP